MHNFHSKKKNFENKYKQGVKQFIAWHNSHVIVVYFLLMQQIKQFTRNNTWTEITT